MGDLKEQFSNKLEISKVIGDPFDHMYIDPNSNENVEIIRNSQFRNFY